MVARLSSGWPVIRVVSLGWSPIRVACVHGGLFRWSLIRVLSSGWSPMSMVSHHGSLLSGLSSGWLLIWVVLRQGGRSSGWSLIGWPLIRMIDHQGGLLYLIRVVICILSGWSFVSHQGHLLYLIRVVICIYHQGGLLYLVRVVNLIKVVFWTSSRSSFVSHQGGLLYSSGWSISSRWSFVSHQGVLLYLIRVVFCTSSRCSFISRQGGVLYLIKFFCILSGWSFVFHQAGLLYLIWLVFHFSSWWSLIRGSMNVWLLWMRIFSVGGCPPWVHIASSLVRSTFDIWPPLPTPYCAHCPLLSVSFSSQVSVPALVVNSTHLSSANSSFASPPRGQNLDTLSPIGPTQIRRSASDVRVDQAGKSDRPEGSMQYNSLPRQGSPGRRRSAPAMKQTVS